jgi:hypothetical protein
MAALRATGSFVVLERQGQARGYRQWLTPSFRATPPGPPLWICSTRDVEI